MKADEIISKAELFANDFIKKLSDSTEQPERKQVYFLDNQDELKKYMSALQKIANSVNDNENVTDEDMVLVDKASNIIAGLKTAVSNFQKELIVNPDATEEDTTAVLSEDTISDAMKSNKTTQEISKNMNAIAEQQKASTAIAYNYALVCDGQINMFLANTKDELNNMINNLANSGNYKDIQLFKMSFVPVPLNKKTVLSV
mgnify:FL=1